MSLCLSREELHELTGYRQRSKVFVWLKDNGFRPRLGSDGWPRVDRKLYEQMMAGATTRRPVEPNYEALRKEIP